MAKGQKFGGRTSGTRNKRTLLKMEEASNQVTAIKRAGLKKATEVLNDLMQTSMSFAARYQQRILAGGDAEPSQQDLDRFWKAMECAGIFARTLAPFQDPTFKAIMVASAPAPEMPRQTEGSNVIAINDPNAVARVYQQMMKRIA